jgi:hypothetical protein
VERGCGAMGEDSALSARKNGRHPMAFTAEKARGNERVDAMMDSVKAMACDAAP